MPTDSTAIHTDGVDLARVVAEALGELQCLFGPQIQLATARISNRAALVDQTREQVVELLRHLALDARDSMPGGGTVTIRAGRFDEVAACGAIIVHETPYIAPPAFGGFSRVRKGRRLSLGALFDAIERSSGHFHVSCRGRETVLTICFPLATAN